jgi:hypothetical protein
MEMDLDPVAEAAAIAEEMRLLDHNDAEDARHFILDISILAKDVLTVPASTVSSESTFSLAGRVLEDRRRRLTPDMVEVLSCIKDWELGDLHSQHTVEKDTKELEVVFEAMYLEETTGGKERRGG